MNTGQMMLVMGALALLSVITLNLNRSYTTSGAAILRSKAGITAISLSTSVLEEASGRAFDKASADDIEVMSLAALTPVASLNKEAGETYPDFDDFDDYNNLVKKDTLPATGIFTTSCKVCYIDPANPTVAAGAPTWHKKLTISVSNPLLVDTVKIEYIFSYFYFR
jgi:hypothetical protein